MDDRKRMEELTELLNRAAEAYYARDIEIMPNVTYDALYDELQMLEEKTGTVLAGSPTLKVGYEAVDYLPKERHASPMLSLAKTKNREELSAWLGDQQGLLSWKEDGLTVVLTYRGGELVLVFDGYKVKGNPGTKEETGGIHIVYTKETESADNYIESLVHEIGKNYRVRVATSDGLIQLTALRMGVQRLSSRELEHEVRKALDEKDELLQSQDRGGYKLGDLVEL